MRSPRHFLLSRPPSSGSALSFSYFPSLASGTIKFTESARVSTGSTLVEAETAGGKKEYRWRTDLTLTRPYWEGWFKGLSKDFLAVRVPKQLILAGSDRMDKELIIGHMQGKFKLDIIPHVGHVIQEDNPRKLAQTVAGLVVAFKIHEDSTYVAPLPKFEAW